MKRPRSTYRLQVNADFTLSQVRELIDYFAALGISDLYLSPLLQAEPGSTHGYDVTHQTVVNEDLGSAQELEALAAELRAHGMGILLDIVPNHMSATEQNPWWRDVLEHGPASPFAHFFDVDWAADPPGPGRVVLPVLADEPQTCVNCGDLRVVLEGFEPLIAYHDRRFPIDPRTFPLLIRPLAAAPPTLPAEALALLESVAAEAAQLPPRADPTATQNRTRDAAGVKQRFSNALRLAGEKGNRDPLVLPDAEVHELLAQQAYALRYWVSGIRDLNYRRFFDVADLAGLRTEDEEVFTAIHSRSVPWLQNGTITGVRIDHIDGLREPTRYLQRLRDAVRARADAAPYVVVEKILVGDEQLPRRWATAGTTGYEFSGLLNGLFVDGPGFAKLEAHFQALTSSPDFGTLVYACKKEVMRELFPAELAALVRSLRACTELDEASAEQVIEEVTACLPVYRTYFGSLDAGAADAAHIETALSAAAAHQSAPERLATFRAVLLSPRTEAQREFMLRWQQFSGPVMAKGLEDTALYRYTPLLSVCDVGSDPCHALTTPKEFHSTMKKRAACWSGSLNGTSTHDSKRSEDVRARINVLSELPDLWLGTLDRWLELNARFRRTVTGLVAPQPAEEIALYQTLLGAWPLTDEPGFGDRILEYLRKSLREAKQHSSWREPNEAYERAVLAFAADLLADRTMNEELRKLEHSTSFHGALNSLSQLVLKLGAPGVPDFYQGSELWSLALVDPDNRRPVDYATRRRRVDTELSQSSRQSWRAGNIKLHVTRAGLALRKEWPELFATGEYVPLDPHGERAGNLIAFERRLGEQSAVFIAGRFYTQLCEPDVWPGPASWNSTTLELRPGEWRERLTNRTINVRGGAQLGMILQDYPFAILTSN